MSEALRGGFGLAPLTFTRQSSVLMARNQPRSLSPWSPLFTDTRQELKMGFSSVEGLEGGLDSSRV